MGKLTHNWKCTSLRDEFSFSDFVHAIYTWKLFTAIIKVFRIGSYTMDKQYSDVTMGAIASPITSLTIAYSIVYSDADQSKHQSSASGNSLVTGEFPAQMASYGEKCFHLMTSSCWHISHPILSQNDALSSLKLFNFLSKSHFRSSAIDRVEPKAIQRRQSLILIQRSERLNFRRSLVVFWLKQQFSLKPY